MENQNFIVSEATSRFNIISKKNMYKFAREVSKCNLQDALAILANLPHKGARIIEKTAKSASANLIYKMPDKKNINEPAFYLYDVIVKEGPTLKRLKARARGRADRIKKRTCHITVKVTNKRINNILA